ncbi:hypothetical protein C8J56DRAFT_885618 [Mycena floridula]|nr:hypothetical protein C8J56DRAFT_885618 [Mycena floridula]
MTRVEKSLRVKTGAYQMAFLISNGDPTANITFLAHIEEGQTSGSRSGLMGRSAISNQKNMSVILISQQIRSSSVIAAYSNDLGLWHRQFTVHIDRLNVSRYLLRHNNRGTYED